MSIGHLRLVADNVPDELDGSLGVLHQGGLVDVLCHDAVPVPPVVHCEGVAAQGLPHLVRGHSVGGASVPPVAVQQNEDAVVSGELLQPEVGVAAAEMSSQVPVSNLVLFITCCPRRPHHSWSLTG